MIHPRFLSLWFRWSLSVAMTLCISKSLAQPVAPVADALKDQLASQRFHYQKAKIALAEGKTAAYEMHLSKLDDYPLKQYLEFARLRKNLTQLPLAEVDSFLATYQDSFLESRLRSHVLAMLASRQKWSDFLRYYKQADGEQSAELLCHSFTARLHASDQTVLNEIAPVWTVGKSQPKACDPAFARWRAAGHQTEDLVWQRMHLAIQNNETGLARYLSTLLTSRKALGELYLKVHAQPQLVTNRSLFAGHDVETQQIIVHGIQRLALKKPLDALKHWELYEAQQLFPDELSLQAKLVVVKRLIREGYSHQAQQILSYSHSLRAQNLVEEIIREALANQDWSRVNDSILLLDEENQASERWQYWRARTQDQLATRFKDFRPSQEVYEALAENRSFYGFLSADLLRRGYALVDDSRPIDPRIRHYVAELDGMRRIHELWTTGSVVEASYEWIFITRQLNSDELLAAGELARDWGWYNSGIRAMISGDLWNQLTVRFPLAYQEQIIKVASDTQVEPTFIYAIARQESAFDERAKSPVGAMGLMQLMPQTAQFTAKTYGFKHTAPSDLLDAEHNMRLGGHYLKHLLGKFDGNRILAAAAYNAGPHRVNRWLSETGKERPFDVWIETIPYFETRHYVQNVLCFSVIYGYRMGQPVRFVSETEASSSL